MNTLQNAEPKVVITEVSSKAIEVLTKAGYYPRIVGDGPIPSVPRYEKGWLIDPVKDVHVYAKRGVEALRGASVPMAGYILAHELEFIEVKEQEEKKEEKSDFKKFSDADILPVLLAVGAVAGAVLLGVLRLALIDPSFIVVIPEGDTFVWVEIVNWYE
jgi:hypothetical protein